MTNRRLGMRCIRQSVASGGRLHARMCTRWSSACLLPPHYCMPRAASSCCWSEAHSRQHAFTWMSGAQGFLRSWAESGFCDKVVNRISEIIIGLKDKRKDVRVFVTGGCRTCITPGSQRLALMLRCGRRASMCKTMVGRCEPVEPLPSARIERTCSHPQATHWEVPWRHLQHMTLRRHWTACQRCRCR